MAVTPSSPPVRPAETDGSAPHVVREPFYQSEEEGIDLRELWDILQRGWKLILAAVLVVLIPVTAWSFIQPSRYNSWALVMVENRESNLGSVFAETPGAELFGGTSRQLVNELLILQQSWTLANTAARELMEYESVPGTDEPLTLLRPVEDEDGEREPTQADVAVRLHAEYLTSSRADSEGGNGLYVAAESTNPFEAALIANVYARTFEDYSQSSSRESINASRQFLEEQVAESRADLEAADQAVRRFMERENAIGLSDETTSLIEQMAVLQGQYDAAAIEVQEQETVISALEREIDALKPSLTTRLASGLDPEIELAEEQLTARRNRLREYYQNDPSLATTPNPPEGVQRLQEEIEDIENRLRGLSEQLAEEAIAAGGSGPGDTQTGFLRLADLQKQLVDARIRRQAATTKRDVLEIRMEEYERQLEAIPSQSIGLAQLQRDRSTAAYTYKTLSEKLQESRVAAESTIGYAEVVRPAFITPDPVAPKRFRNIFLALLLGLGLGAGVAIARVRLDHRLHRPDDLERVGITHIGTIPDTTDLIQTDFDGKEFIPVGDREVDTHLVALLNPMAAASEAYRALRTNVQFSRPDALVQTVVVTSANPGEGKSVTAGNLAAVMAQSGRRVLLIDADLRRPSLHKKFGLSEDPGLLHLLFSDDSFVKDDIHEVADDLFVLTAGHTIPNPSEMLSSQRMRELLEEVKSQFDVIILDAPPVLAATDSVLLATQADATFLVARAGRTQDFELLSAYQALTDVGANVIGTVLNGFDISNAYGYKYKYAYRYQEMYAYGSGQYQG